MGEGSTVPAAQWDWSSGVCSSQQEWAPSQHSSSDRRGISGEKELLAPWDPVLLRGHLVASDTAKLGNKG